MNVIQTVLLISVMCLGILVFVIIAFLIGCGISYLPMWIDFVVAALGVILFVSSLISIDRRGNREIEQMEKEWAAEHP